MLLNYQEGTAVWLRMEHPIQFSNCSNGTDLAEINLVFSVTGAVCCFISILIILYIVCGKAYHTVLQRLFLYLMVAIVLRELFIAAAIEHHWNYQQQDMVCRSIGFLWNWTGVLVFAFTVGIKIYLLILVKHVARGSVLPRLLQTKSRRVIMESLYVSLLTVVTLGYAGIPFSTKNYGLAGAWCWIRALDKNCTLNKAGLLNQLFNGYIFYVSGSVIGLILLIAVSIVYCRLPVTHAENRLLLKKTFCVIITFVVNIVIMGFALATRVTAAENRMYRYPPLWVAFGVAFPVSLLLFPITYLICFSLGKKAEASISFLCKCFKRRERRVNAHSFQAPTVRESSRVSANSETLSHSLPYTDEFTSIHANVLGYGSISQRSTELGISIPKVVP